VLVSGRVAEELGREHGFPVGFTYYGHPTACAVALKNLEIIEREGLLARARDTGRFLLERLKGLEALPVVGEVRGLGMMLGIELVSDKHTREPISMHQAPHDVIRRETGVLVRDCAHTLVLSPPLVMTEQESEEVVVAVRSVLERMAPDGSIAPL
jgi:putrescine aminotransferase